MYAAADALLQSCLNLCDPIDSSPPGFPSLGFSRQEHWNGLPFPSPMRESEVAQCPTLATPWTAAYRASLSKGFSRQEYWSRVPLPSPSLEGLDVIQYWGYWEERKWKWMFSIMSDSETPWIVACQAPLSMGILQVRILEWVVISYSRGSSRPKDRTRVSYVSCIGRWVL